jgi:hypothetical protein
VTAELDDISRAVLEQLETLIRLGRSVADAAAQLERMGIDADLIYLVVQFRRQLAASQRSRTVDEGALFDPELVGTAWYTGTNSNDVFWPRLKSTLLADPRWADAVRGLDQASHEIVSLLADPHSPQIRTRGLVMGHVQSGKTANFTATIAKAADAGYRMFIVLSGVHNALRRQTQLRLDRQLVDLEPRRWLPLTDEHKDFGNPVRALALVAGTDLRLLAIVKKNGSRLRRLRDWMHVADEQGGFDTCPVLIIDDEADQASPNSSRNPDLDRTTINGLIVDILRMPRIAYVGYTATPFANVLIDPAPPEDLYPKHFIYALPKPSDYFGAEELFGLGAVEDEDATDHDMIRLIPESEAELHRVRRGEAFDPELTPALAEAVRWFLLATAARRIRSSAVPHSSMLVHTTQRVAAQFMYLPLLRDAVRDIRRQVEGGDIAELQELWERETSAEPADRHGLSTVPFDDVLTALESVLNDANVVVDNGQSLERLLYDDAIGTAVIAVGGNTLSRGLTLEGLVASYFLRGANAYDTLLQMGRWFGYKPGYGDLPRIWTTGELVAGYRHLADVESDIRLEVERYVADQTTPLDVAVRIKLHPKMRVTNQLRMQYAVPASTSFSGQCPQTILFHHRDLASVMSNAEAARSFAFAARAAGSEPEPTDSALIFRDVPVELVVRFLAAYRFHEESELSSRLLADYIESQNRFSQLLVWNAAIVTRADSSAGTTDLGAGFDINLIERSKFRDPEGSATANIGTLRSRPDLVADLMSAQRAAACRYPDLIEARTSSGRALLSLYPISKNSKPRSTRGRRERIALDAIDHLVGVGLAFPSAPHFTDRFSTVSVDLSKVRPAFDDRDEGAVVEDDEYNDDEGDRNEVDLDAGH